MSGRQKPRVSPGNTSSFRLGEAKSPSELSSRLREIRGVSGTLFDLGNGFVEQGEAVVVGDVLLAEGQQH